MTDQPRDSAGPNQRDIAALNADPQHLAALYDANSPGHAFAVEQRRQAFEAAHGTEPVEEPAWPQPVPTEDEMLEVQAQSTALMLKGYEAPPEVADALGEVAAHFGLDATQLVPVAEEFTVRGERGWTEQECLEALGPDAVEQVARARRLVAKVDGLGAFLDETGLGNSARLIRLMADRAAALAIEE